MTFIPATAITLEYMAFLGTLFFVCFNVHKQKREGRFPLGEDARALRRAGEQLSRKLSALNEQFGWQFGALVVSPIVGLALPAWIAEAFGPVNP